VPPLTTIPLDEIRRAQDRIRGTALRTPLVPLNVSDAPANIYLKLENLQPIGSFKIRGASNAIAAAPANSLARGVYTASAGNMAQGVAWHARRMSIPCTVIVPDHAPDTKLDAIARLGGEVVKVPFDRWWQVLVERGYPGIEGVFIHPVSDPLVMAGNGTIGLEILEDLPAVDCVIAPYGGGGLSLGIASALRALSPSTKVYACEADTAAPLAASFAAGRPEPFDYIPSFIDGMGGKSILPEMWPLARELLSGPLVVSLAEVASALKLLVERNRVVAEGAGAAPVAAALNGSAGSGTIVCIVSGGNIDTSRLIRILSEQHGITASG
jgi:threonine dehydratase